MWSLRLFGDLLIPFQGQRAPDRLAEIAPAPMLIESNQAGAQGTVALGPREQGRPWMSRRRMSRGSLGERSKNDVADESKGHAPHGPFRKSFGADVKFTAGEQLVQRPSRLSVGAYPSQAGPEQLRQRSSRQSLGMEGARLSRALRSGLYEGSGDIGPRLPPTASGRGSVRRSAIERLFSGRELENMLHMEHGAAGLFLETQSKPRAKTGNGAG